MVHQRAARLLLFPLVFTAFGLFPTAAHADDGECHEGKQASDCEASCDDDIEHGRERDDDHSVDDERDEVRRSSRGATSSSNRGKGSKGDDELDDVDDHLEIDDDCLPPAVVPEVSLVVLLPASAAGVLVAIAYVGRRRRLRVA